MKLVAKRSGSETTTIGGELAKRPVT